MKTATPVSVEEYLGTAYDPDVDYRDGEIEERNLGEGEHSQVQGEIHAQLREQGRRLGFRASVEVRIRIGQKRYLVPDVCVVLGRQPLRGVLETAPFLCVEVLSPEDRFGRVTRRLDEYVQFGVSHVWLVDPVERVVYEHGPGGLKEVKEGVLRTGLPGIELRMAEVWGEVDG